MASLGYRQIIILERMFLSLKLMVFELAATDDVSEPYANSYSPLLGRCICSLEAGLMPKYILRDGINQFEIKLDEGKQCTINFIDLAIK